MVFTAETNNPDVLQKVLNLVYLNRKNNSGKMEGIKYLTDEKGKRIAVQIELKKHKRFIQEYLDYIEDRTDVIKTWDEEIIPFDEVISKFEKQHGRNV